MSYRNYFIGKKKSELINFGGGSGTEVFKGKITIPADFPDPLLVRVGWEYIIDNPVGVTDNDPTKTNTGQSFADEVFIVWNGIDWSTEGENFLLADNGTDLAPVESRGFNVLSGQAYKVNNVDVLTTAQGYANTAESNAESYADEKFVTQTTTVNGHALSGNVTVTALDLGLENALKDKGTISIASQFPTLVNVKVGDLYRFTAAVTDNDIAKTNTGQTFIIDDVAYWNGVNYSILGKAQATAAKDYADGITEYSGVTTITVGGITAGTTLTSDPVLDVLDKMLRPYINPAFTSFALTGITTVEVGTKITGNQTFTWAISTVGNVNANSINIFDITNALTLVSSHSVTSPAVYDFNNYSGGGLEYGIAASNVWQIQGTNTQSVQFTRNLTVAWDWKWYAGSNANLTLTNAQVLALSSALAIAFPSQASASAGQYFHLLIPTTWVQPTIFKNHATGFAVAMNSPVLQSVTNSLGIAQNYYDYCSTNVLINAITIDIS